MRFENADHVSVNDRQTKKGKEPVNSLNLPKLHTES